MAHYVYEGVHYELPDGLSNEQAVDKIKTHLGQGANKTAPSSDWTDTAKDIGKKYVGAREAELSFLSGMGAQIPAAVGAGLSAINDLTAGREVKFKDAYENILHGLTYEPKTDEGKDIADDIGKSGFMQSMNAVGGVAHTLPPLTIRPSVRGTIPKSAKSPVDIALENIEKQRSETSAKTIPDVAGDRAIQEITDQQTTGWTEPYDPAWNRPRDRIQDVVDQIEAMQRGPEGQQRIADQTHQRGAPIEFTPDQAPFSSRLGENPQQGIDTSAFMADEMSRPVENQIAANAQKLREQEAAWQEHKAAQAREEALAARETDLADLQEALSVPRNSKGQQRKAMAGRKNQRGAIDVEAVSDAIDKFKSGVGDALNVLHSFKGTFNDVEMQLAEKAMSSETSRDHVVLMSPDEFHQLAAPRGEWGMKGAGAEIKRDNIREGLKSQKGLSDIPYLLYDKNGRVIAHEGRHRMDVFKEQGVSLVPVRIRGYDGRELPQQLHQEISPLRQKSNYSLATPRPIRLPQSQRGSIILGEKAGKNIDLAKKLLKQKMSPATVFDLTGVYKDGDGKFKTALSDNNAKVIIQGFTKGHGNLSTILDFPELFKFYPQLKKVFVFKTQEEGASVFKDRNRYIIHINERLSKEDFKRHLLHELQHVIQKEEGFSKGGDPVELSNKHNLPYSTAFDHYDKLPGEQEARFTENNSDLTQLRLEQEIKTLLQKEQTPSNRLSDATTVLATKRKAVVLPSSQRGGVNLDAFTSKEKIEATEKVLQTKLYAPEVKAQDVIQEALQSGKDSGGTTNFSAGGTLEAMKRNSPLIRGITRIIQRFLNIADDKIRMNVIPVEKAFRGLKPGEVIDLSKVFIKEMFAKEEFTPKELASIGLSDKQLIAYNQMRNMFEKALEDINQSRTERGLKPVTKHEAYLSSRWRGDFRRAIYDKEGNLAWYLAAETKKGLDRQTQALMKDFPELVPGEHLDHIKGSGRYKTTSTGEMYLAMKDFLGADNERVKALEQWYHEQVKLDSEGAYAQTKHFIHKGNIRGFVGDRPGVAGTKAEALAMFQEQINYAKNAHKWAGITRAGNELKSIFSNEELNKQQPKNMAYAREYFENQVGLNTWDAVRAVEDSLHNIGTSIHELKKVTNSVKSAWILQKLTGSLGYVASQGLQAANMIPHLLNMAWKEKANPLIVPAAFIQGAAEGLLMATGHLMKQSENLIKGAAYRPGDSVFSAKAMKYAEDNGIITRSLTDESPIESSFSKTGRALKAANWTLSTPEAYLRSVVYMTYAHAYKMIGKLPELEVFRKAEELTNASMGDYRSGERAPIFSKMGAAGDVANILQTYPVNFYNQYSWAAREAGRLNPVPIFAMLGTHYMVAGMMGIPGFQDLDKLWTWTKKQIADRDPDLWMKVKDLDLKELAIKTLGKSGLYGAVSTQSGISMTSRAAAPAGSEMLVNPAAPYVDMAQQLGSLGNAAVKRDAQSATQAVLDLAPVGVQGALETGPLKNQTSVVNSKGERIYGKTTDLAAREGMIKRTPQEERLRSLGFRSQREVEEREAAYKAKAKEQQALSVARQLPDKAWNAIRNGDKEKTREYVKLYSQIMGTQMTEDMFSKRALDEYTTAAEKVQIKNKTIPGLVALKQLKDIIKEENVSK